MIDEAWRELVMRTGEFNLVPHLTALAIAYLLALPIAWDREQEERSAGLRTFPLVAIASCGFLQAAETIIQGNPEATARVVEGIITGMGFIGGGAILILKASVRGTQPPPACGRRVQLAQPLDLGPTTLPSFFRS